ncbi:MAG TPA: RIP metalloprotease RseP [Acidiphilium sp.]|uniref:RIP metalloprotease RseP n=1 Tax=unclassified Acidiphilium TaxID=2617493 RepID=UPI000BCA86FD|nr:MULTISPECIES: RIP metalloprotease RseP [unclassified Acidiphilium]OYV56506.1 MAG: RIP metalloprotease RseP [Acidiphilium sp. 20-67-58]HQT59805.1 RIP metalloprotease RseP [Acidiphilium sp.]HQU10373.1 RIP metalloprotease RseP [Acidiphilium sp.]
MTDLLRSVLGFIVVLGVLVTVHELGHYLVARWRGVTVEVFSLGFGPTLVSRIDRHGTIWKLSAIPLGGYVRMRGWAEFGAESGASVDPGSFGAKPLAARAAVVAAGPVANFLLAIVLFSAIFATSGVPTVLPVVSKVLAGSPAQAAGLVKGDRIVSMNGAPISTFDQLSAVVAAHPGGRIALSYERGGQTRSLDLSLGSVTAGGRQIGRLGIEGADVRMRRLSPPRALLRGVAVTWQASMTTLHGLWQLVDHQKGLNQLGGPVRIAQISGQAVAHGLTDLLSFMALLSVNLGLINLVPIPVLDGGHLLFYAAEAAAGRALPRRVQEIALQFGAALLVCLIVFVTWHDIAHLVG